MIAFGEYGEKEEIKRHYSRWKEEHEVVRISQIPAWGC